MLPELHLAIKLLFYGPGRVPPGEVDVSFEMPTREWLASLTRPTLNLFLFELEENTELRQTALPPTAQTIRTAAGELHGIQRMPARRFDLRYLVCAPSTVVEHEHLLLWRALVTLLKYQQLPTEVLEATFATSMREAGLLAEDQAPPIPRRGKVATREELYAFAVALDGVGRLGDGLATLSLDPPISGQVAQIKEGPRLHDLWGAFDLPPRPALIYTVTVPIDLDIAVETPLVLRRVTRYTVPDPGAAGVSPGVRPELVTARDTSEAERAPLNGVTILDTRVQEHGTISGVVRDRNGRPLPGVALVVAGRERNRVVSDADGRFTMAEIPQGSLQIRAVRPRHPPQEVTLSVPSERYVIELD